MFLSSKKPPSTALLDLDRANSAFRLLFLFVQDESLEIDEQMEFELVIREIFQGLSLPKSALSKLKRIYTQVLATPPRLIPSLEEVARDFSTDRDVLVSLVRILLRLISDDGMISSRHCMDLEILLSIFKFNDVEIAGFTEYEEALLSSALGRNILGRNISVDGNRSNNKKRDETLLLIASLCETLGCSSDSSIETIKKTYRKRAMELHPDRSKLASPMAPEVDIEEELSFNDIHDAYLQLMELLSGAREGGDLA